MQSHTSPATPARPPVNLDRGLLIGTSILLGSRDPQTIRRWIVEWSVDGDCYALAGPLEFAMDLGNALFEVDGPEKVDGVFLYPCVRGSIENGFNGTPIGAYVAARETLRMFTRDPYQHEVWEQALRRVGFDLPDTFALAELSERTKAKKPDPVHV